MEIDIKQLSKNAEKYDLQMVVLFGSQVTGRVDQNSDYDLAILTKKNKDISKDINYYNEVLFFLSKSMNIPKDKIDLTNLRTATPLLLHEIFDNSQLIYGNNLQYEEWRAIAFRKFINHQSLFELRREIIQQRQQILRKKIYA